MSSRLLITKVSVRQADVFRRTVVFPETSVATTTSDTPWNLTEATLMADDPDPSIELTDIESYFLLHCDQTANVEVRQAGGDYQLLTCTGLFAFTGQINSVRISRNPDVAAERPLRLKIIYN